MQLALRVLEELTQSRVVSPERISAVNVRDAQQIQFVLDARTEVRCGAELELTVQLRRLKDVLKVLHRKRLAVQYIDMRFEEPVIGPAT